MMQKLTKLNRSYRKFDNTFPVTKDQLKNMIQNACYCPSAGNLMPLRYFISNNNEINNKIFDNLGWAAYLKDWQGPTPNEQPTAYIIILSEKAQAKYTMCDTGIAAQTILLSAVEMGLGGCLLANFNNDKLKKDIQIPEQYDVCLVIAIGKPTEKIIIEHVTNNDVKYWRDDKLIHHVPKRDIKEVIINE